MNRRVIVIAAAACAAAACGSDPAYYDQPRYGSGPYYSQVADHDYGRVVGIDRVGGHTSGAGAVVGGIVGGVLGHQVGSGRGNDVATAAGAIGGAVAGNEIEKRRNDERYRIVVRFRDGRESAFEQDDLYGIRVGDRVHVDGGRVIGE